MPPEARISRHRLRHSDGGGSGVPADGHRGHPERADEPAARIIDRTRKLEDDEGSTELSLETYQRVLLAGLRRRAHLVNQAITFCTTCALLICVVIMALFVGAITNLDRA